MIYIEFIKVHWFRSFALLSAFLFTTRVCSPWFSLRDAGSFTSAVRYILNKNPSYSSAPDRLRHAAFTHVLNGQFAQR
jgi:hypothetical protein